MSSDASTPARPTRVNDPADLSRSDYVGALKRTLREVKDDDVPSLAAGVAFRMFLSLFPALIATVAVFSIVIDPAELSRLVEQARAVMPSAAADVIERQLTELTSRPSGAGLALVSGVAVGLFAATSAAVALMKALSRAYDVAETRKFVRQRLVALALVVALLVALVALVALLVLGPQLQDAVLPDVPAPLDVLLAIGRGVLALVLLAVLFAFVYWVGPNRDHPSWVWMSPGAALAVVGWLLVAGGFTLYAQTAGSYNETYGFAAGVAVLLIWLQLSMLVLLVGAEFNAEIERTRALYGAVREGAGFAIPAPGAALMTGDPETGRAAMLQGKVEAPRIGGGDPLADPTAEVTLSPPPPVAPAPVGPSPAASATPDRRRGGGPAQEDAVADPRSKGLAAVTAAVMAAAVFLGFARRGRP